MPSQKTRKRLQQKQSRHLRFSGGSMPQSGSFAARRPQQPAFSVFSAAAPEGGAPSAAGAAAFFELHMGAVRENGNLYPSNLYTDEHSRFASPLCLSR